MFILFICWDHIIRQLEYSCQIKYFLYDVIYFFEFYIYECFYQVKKKAAEAKAIATLYPNTEAPDSA